MTADSSKSVSMPYSSTSSIAGLVLVGAAIRIALSLSPSAQSTLASRVEIATPVTASNRLWECVHSLHSSGSPYDSSLCHEPALFVYAMQLLRDVDVVRALFYTAVELMTALAIMLVARRATQMIAVSCAEQLQRAKDDGTIVGEDKAQRRFEFALPSVQRADGVATMAMAAYLFHPYSIMACVAQSSAVFENAQLAVTLALMLHERTSLACLSVALCTYRSPYSAQLIVPLILHAHNVDRSTGKSLVKTSLCLVAQFALGLALLFGVSLWLVGDWSFLVATHQFVFMAEDLTPNVGLHWYFFTEMFDHFRTLYNCVFQLNMVVYVLPLAVALSHDATSLYVVQLMLLAIFKPYPSVADAALYMPLLIVYAHLSSLMRYGLVAGVTMIVCTLFAPVMWSLWIVQGSANANFYFATTLAYSTAQVFMLTDLLYALLRHRMHLRDGAKEVDKEGNKIEAVLH